MARLGLLFRLPRILPPQRLLFAETPIETLPRSLYPRLGGHARIDERL